MVTEVKKPPIFLGRHYDRNTDSWSYQDGAETMSGMTRYEVMSRDQFAGFLSFLILKAALAQ